MRTRKTSPTTSARPSSPARQRPERTAPRLDVSPVITHSEVFERVEQGGCLRGVVVEAQDDGAHPRYAAFLLSSWRKEYTVLGFDSAERPRLFRGLERLLALVRVEYGFRGTIALRLASEGPLRHQTWRITHATDFPRSPDNRRWTKSKRMKGYRTTD